MSKIAFLFPGQGSQEVGMGKDIYEKYEEARKIYEKASEILNINVAKLCFESSQEELARTDNTQIAILVTSLAILEVLKNKGIEADVAAGLSLGEYTALIYSGVISFEEGLKLVRQRGKFMQELKPEGNWKMAAILGLDASVVEEVCDKVNSSLGFVVPANYNYAGQIVVSGKEKAVDEVIKEVTVRGAKRAIPLNTSGPFHTEKLEEAKCELEKELEKIEICNGDVSVIKNIDGTMYTGDDNIKEILARHMVSPVRFDKEIEYMISSGVDTFIEIGPGRTLTGFVRKVNRDLKCININNVESLEEVLNG